jgi:squalene-hopene/tetraprenyl-beta-curcumene cyclase
MKLLALRVCFISALIAANLAAAEAPTPHKTAGSWDAKAAGGYLDGRMTWWMNWPTAARDHGTFCVSCHTAVTYAVGRPALRSSLSETAPSTSEQQLLDNVAKRVRMWAEVEPFYPDKLRGVPKTIESRGTESILNALILARYGTPDAKLALDHMWAEQLKEGDAKGAWNWLQFHNAPWEGDSQYYGATLAAVAAGFAPPSYRSTPEVQDHIQALRQYLVMNRGSQTLMDRVILLWASTKLPDLLTHADQKSLIAEALEKQQADGGFSLTAFVGGWKRHDDTPLETKSDGYATGVVAYVLQEAGVPRTEPQMQRALAWLEHNQEKSDGRWLAYSLNKQRVLDSDVGRFMSDAATAYAVLALTDSR